MNEQREAGDGWHNPVEQQLQCFVQEVRFLFEKNAVQVLLKEGSRADMTGSIKVATSLMPSCTTIHTYEEDGRIFAYLKRDGAWVSGYLKPKKEAA